MELSLRNSKSRGIRLKAARPSASISVRVEAFLLLTKARFPPQRGKSGPPAASKF